MYKATPLQTGLWPKVYVSKSPQFLGIDNNSNLLMYLHEDYDLNIHINHLGPMPTSQSTTEGNYAFHYNANTGVTSWAKPDILPMFITNVGDAQTAVLGYSNLYNFHSCETGLQTNPITFIPNNEIIISQLDPQTYLTRDYYSLRIRNNLGVVNILNTFISKSYFNQSTKKLYLIKGNGVYSFDIDVYDLINNTFNFINSASLPPTTWNNPTTIVQVDNQNRIFCIKDHKLQQYSLTNNSFNQVNILGFNNDNVIAAGSSKPNTDDFVVVTNTGENKIYRIDLTSFSQRNSTILNINPYSLHYVINENYLFLCGINFPNSSIGSQVVPYATPTSCGNNSTFLTKLNLLTDFNFTSLQEPLIPSTFEISVSPNPSNNILKLNTDDKLKNGIYTLIITNQFGTVKLKKQNYFVNTNLDISTLRKGVYFVELVNSKGEKSAKSFIKL